MIIRLKANGVIPHGDEYGNGCGLAGNKGFTLPSNIGELGDDITELNLRYCSLTGPRSTRTERLRILLTNLQTLSLLSGALPKVLPVSLEVLNLGDSNSNTNKFTGGIPSEWGALTNLKELTMANCGLGGKLLSTHTERFDRRD